MCSHTQNKSVPLFNWTALNDIGMICEDVYDDGESVRLMLQIRLLYIWMKNWNSSGKELFPQCGAAANVLAQTFNFL